jgi:hypothetical protein
MIERVGERDVALSRRRTHLVRQAARLSIGTAGLVGGVFLLSTNAVAVLTTAAGSIPWLPFSANMALIIGSAMFLREYRRARATSRRSDGQ